MQPSVRCLYFGLNSHRSRVPQRPVPTEAVHPSNDHEGCFGG